MLTLGIVGILFAVIGVIASLMLKSMGKKSISYGAMAGGIVLGVILVCLSCIRTVPTGHTGIVTTFGKVEDTTYEAGVHFVPPWKTVINMDNRNQKASVNLMCFSSDIQEVSVVYTFNYQI